jgi:hypothetical protein
MPRFQLGYSTGYTDGYESVVPMDGLRDIRRSQRGIAGKVMRSISLEYLSVSACFRFCLFCYVLMTESHVSSAHTSPHEPRGGLWVDGSRVWGGVSGRDRPCFGDPWVRCGFLLLR